MDHETKIAIDDSFWYLAFLTPLDSNQTLDNSAWRRDDEGMVMRSCHFAEEVQNVVLIIIEDARITAM